MTNERPGKDERTGGGGSLVGIHKEGVLLMKWEDMDNV